MSAHNNFDLVLFVLPALILIITMVELPFVMNIYYSFTKWNGLDKIPVFIGIDNFIEAFGNSNFINALIFTFKYTFWVVILTNVLAMAFAVILDRPFRLKNIFRTIFFLPNVISLVVIGFMWRYIFTLGFQALYNLTQFEIFQWSWIGDYKLAWISMILVTVWQSVGYLMVIYIAGLQSIPQEVLESAEIDGATGFSKFFTITLPLVMPAVTVCVFLTLANSLKVYDIVVALTGGGPGDATVSIAYNIFRESIQNFRYGFGTAQSFIFFVIILAVTSVQVRIFKKMEVES